VRDGCRAHKILKASHVRSCLFRSSISIISFISCMLFRRSFYVGTVNQSHDISTTLIRIRTHVGGPALTHHPSWMCRGSVKCAGTDRIKFRRFIASVLLVTELLSVCGAVVLGRLCNSSSAAPHERPGPLPNEQSSSRHFAVPSFRLQKGCRLASTATQIHSYRPSP
jgi:hypothetical protein